MVVLSGEGAPKFGVGIDVGTVSEFSLEFCMEVSVEVGMELGVEVLSFGLFGAGSSLIWVLVTESFVDFNCSNFARRFAIWLLRRNGFTSAASVFGFWTSKIL